MTQILPSAQIVFQHCIGEFGRKFCYFGREFVRQVILAQCNFNFHPGRRVIAQNLDNAAYGLGIFAGLLDDLHYHHLPRLGTHRFLFGHQNILADTPVLRLYEQNAMIGMESPHQLCDAALQHFHDGSFPAPAPVHAGFAQHHAVTVQHLVHFLWTQK